MLPLPKRSTTFFLTFKNLEESVKHEVKYLQENPLVLKETTVTGWIYDVRTGRLSQCLCFSSHSVTLSFLYRPRKLFNSCQRDNCMWLIHDLCTVDYLIMHTLGTGPRVMHYDNYEYDMGHIV
jgi:hypothetical protein